MESSGCCSDAFFITSAFELRKNYQPRNDELFFMISTPKAYGAF
jgi:hypothetical protein